MLPTAASGVMLITKKMIAMNTTTVVISIVYNISHRETTRVDLHPNDLINKCSASPSSSSQSNPPPTGV